MIGRYQFGKVSIDGIDYDSDVIVYSDHVKDRWWRKEGHHFCLDDLKGILGEQFDTLVVGTGYFGRMKIDPVGLAGRLGWNGRDHEILGGRNFQRYVCECDESQYRPCYRAFRYPPLERRITEEEYEEAIKLAKVNGLHRLHSERSGSAIAWMAEL